MIYRQTSSSSSHHFSFSLFTTIIVTFLIVATTTTTTTTSSVLAANMCKPVSFVNGSKVSWFNVPSVNWPQLTQIGLGGGSFQFSFKPCDSSLEVPNAPQQCPGSFLSQTGCEVQFKSMEVNYPVVVFNQYISIKYKSTSKGYDWTANVNLRCNLNVRDTIICQNNQYDATQTNGKNGPIFLSFDFESRAFCTDDSRGGIPSENTTPSSPSGDNGFQITWGVVFLASFFGPLIIYLLIMIPWNCKEGKRGKEVCPNVEFWGSLPGLAYDGITYLVSRVRGNHWQSCENDYEYGGARNSGLGGGREVGGNSYGAASF